MNDNRCPHHAQCRADRGRPDDQLCGYHHAKTWSWCMLYQAYQSRQREEKALARAYEAISETIGQ